MALTITRLVPMHANHRRPFRRVRAGLMAAMFLISMLVAVGLGAAPSSAAPGAALSSWSTAVVNLPNGGIAPDPTRGTVLVSVAPSVRGIGNHLVELDATTGAIGRSVPVGSDPRAIAVADDGSRAYVGLMGSPRIVEVDLVTFTVTRSIWLGNASFYGPRYAEDIEVQPGNPEVIAVSRRYVGLSPRNAGAAIFDDGVQRPATSASHTGANRITWSDDPNVLYGYNNETTGYGFYVLTVDANGITMTSPGKRMTGFSLDIGYADGEVVATNGQVVQTSDLALSDSYTASGSFAIDAAADRAYFLAGSTLSVHDTTTKLSVASRTVPAIAPTQLVDVGSTLAAAGPNSVLLLGPGVSASGFVAPTAPASKVQAWGTSTTMLDLSELAAAPNGTRLYGVARQSAPQHPGSVVEMDPATGAVIRTLFVGADPERIATSADGSTLLVGHYGANQLTEIDASTMTVRRTIALPAGEWASDIAPRPGTANTFAVVLVNHCCSPALEGQILVEDGVILPGRGPDHTGATTIAFGADPDRLYGFNGGTTDYGFYTLAVGPTGLQPLSSVGSLIQGFNQELVSSDGMIFASRGAIVDPTVPAVLGAVASTGEPVPVTALRRHLIVTGTAIVEYDLDSYALVASTPFTAGTTRDAVLVGDHLAIATTNGKLALVPIGDDTRVAPTVSSLDPPEVPVTGGTTVTISGSSFTYATSVEVDGVPTPFTIADDTTITLTVPPHAGGSVPITVTNPIGTSSGGPTLTYLAPEPELNGLWPPGGPTAGGNPVTLTGTGLSYATDVSFGGVPATSFEVGSDGEIQAVAPAGAAGEVEVTVTTAGGTTAPSALSRYTYDAGIPTVTSVSPNSGLRSGGEVVEIAGSSFYGATEVEFGSGNEASFEVISDTLIEAEAPPHSPGIVNVVVTNANGTSAATPFLSWFAYLEPLPAVTSVSPASGPTGGGNLVAIRGDHLSGAIAVRFGTNDASNLVVIDDGLLLATAPSGTAGTVELVVTTPHGSSDPADASYTYGAAPQITSVSPAEGPTTGGTLVSIFGQGFTDATAVQFGLGTVAPIYSVVSDTRIDVLSPPKRAATVDVRVSTPFGTSAAGSASFRYVAIPPGAPRTVAATALDGTATVTWTPPSSDGGSAITAYVVTPHIGGVAQAPVTVAAPATSSKVSGLVNGIAYTFTVMAENAAGLGAPSSHSAAVTPHARPPIADAGPDQQVAKGVSFTLDGSASSDPDDEPLTYLWEQISGPVAVIVDPRQKYASVNPVANDGRLVFRLTVTDSNGNVHTDTVQITVGSPK